MAELKFGARSSDLIDDYVIRVTNGRRVRRDVQIEKLPAVSN